MLINASGGSTDNLAAVKTTFQTWLEVEMRRIFKLMLIAGFNRGLLPKRMVSLAFWTLHLGAL